MTHLLTKTNGKPWSIDGFRHLIGDTLTEMGFDDYTPHGLRKNAVGELLEAGCTVAETAAITGQSFQVVEHYAKDVRQAMLADEAINKWWENRK